MNLDGSAFRQLTNDGAFKFLPHFSPDATKVAYTLFLARSLRRAGRRYGHRRAGHRDRDTEGAHARRAGRQRDLVAGRRAHRVHQRSRERRRDPPGRLAAHVPSQPSCVEGVPKGSPDGRRVLLFRGCFDTGALVSGIYVTDSAGSYRKRITDGFGPDWNPVAK
jgi:hypothetical protein